MGIYKFGNNTYPWRIRRRSNLGHIFREKKCVLWARKYSNFIYGHKKVESSMRWFSWNSALPNRIMYGHLISNFTQTEQSIWEVWTHIHLWP